MYLDEHHSLVVSKEYLGLTQFLQPYLLYNIFNQKFNTVSRLAISLNDTDALPCSFKGSFDNSGPKVEPS